MAKKSAQPRPASRSLALRRGLEILCLFTDARREWGITELANHLDEHKSIVHRTVKTLEDAGFLRQDTASQKYSLGFMAYQLGVFASRRLGFGADTRARMRRLTEEIGATVYVVVRDGDANRIVDTFETSALIRFHSPVGTRVPWNRGASSKLLCAFAPENEVQQLLRKPGLRQHAKQTITEPRAFLAELAHIRERGYSTSDGEGFDGVFGIAAPLCDLNGEVMAALQSSMLSVGLNEKRRGEIAKIIVRAAREVSFMLRAAREGDAPAVRAARIS
jgi:DNA-binding IclR family transcriptional regulator